MEELLYFSPGKDSEWERFLAQLPESDRARFLGKDLDLRRVWANKAFQRQLAADLPVSEKVRKLEEMIKTAELRRGARMMAQPETAVPRPFGGRSTAAGVRYEVRVAAWIAAKMLAGNAAIVWEGIHGSDVLAITLQAAEPVDDVVADLRDDAKVFIAVKQRSRPIPLGGKSPAFNETIEAFVRQFQKQSSGSSAKARLVWAVPGSAGAAVTHHLAGLLNTFRGCDERLLIQEFASNRGREERRVMEQLLSAVNRAWVKITRKPPEERELGGLLRMMYVEVFDFERGNCREREAMMELSRNILADPSEGARAWRALERHFTMADERGIPVTVAKLRNALIDEEIGLKASPDYSEDVERLRKLTGRNVRRLEEHTQLRFGPGQSNAIHLNRSSELGALQGGIASGHILITGEPGSGKSGLVHSLVAELKERQSPVVLLLAEEIMGRDWKGAGNLPGLSHSLDDVLAHWPSGQPGYLITDALDAVRDTETQKMLRRLLHDVKEGQSGWTVVASVREFDLEYGRELREMFPGLGVDGYATKRFEKVAHFHVPRLSDAQLDALIARRREIRPFIESARKSRKSENLHRSPFYLRLAAELLGAGESASRVADWNSPAVLLRKFWEIRIREGTGSEECEIALRAICEKMVVARSMTISTTELGLGRAEREGIKELRSRGILETPVRSHGSRVGDDELRFTHHLLHDYAIAAALIPKSKERFPPFVLNDPLFPILYRQSTMFALEELWDADSDNGRGSFWVTALLLENMPELNGITRILAPVLAARRVAVPEDLGQLLDAIRAASAENDASLKAVQHLASGLQDAEEETVRGGALAWSSFADALSELLGANPRLEAALVHIVARLNSLIPFAEEETTVALNSAARRLLAHHLGKAVKDGWRYSALIAMEVICKTFAVSPAESKEALLDVLRPERLRQFPHDDLSDLANMIKYLGPDGKEIVIRLFQAAFTDGPEPGQWEQFSPSAILPMRFQTADQWNGIRYALADYYEALEPKDARLLSEIACIAWNAASRAHVGEARSKGRVLGCIEFRGFSCELVEDYSHISGRGFEHDENRILTHFEQALRQWAAADDRPRLDQALDSFAKHNRSSLMWTIFMEAGSEYPSHLGAALEEVLSEPLFLTHPDYSFGGTALLASLHKTGDRERRQRLEGLVLSLPDKARPKEEVDSDLPSRWLAYAQNRILGVLEDGNIVLREVRELKDERQTVEVLPRNEKLPVHREPRFLPEWEAMERRGVNLSDPVNSELFRQRQALELFLNRQNRILTLEYIESNWGIIEECESILGVELSANREMAEDLWGHLVGACENIVNIATWRAEDPRWDRIARILLKAAKDPEPRVDEGTDDRQDGIMSWGWPAPRLDAARGLPFLAMRLGAADETMAETLRTFCRDGSAALRLNLAERLTLLSNPAPNLMWEMLDTFVAEERRFAVLVGIVGSLDGLWHVDAERVLTYLDAIAKRASVSAPPEHQIHGILASTHLFNFLRRNEGASKEFITCLISKLETISGSKAITPLLHACRAGGWLTIGNAVQPDTVGDEVRARAWWFFTTLLTEAQTKVNKLQEKLIQLGPSVIREDEKVKAILEPRDRALRLVDGISMQLYFASGTFEATKRNGDRLSPAQLHRFWKESAPLFRRLANEMHPHLVYHLIQTFRHLLACAPVEIFLLAAQSIRNSSKVGFQNESLAVGEIVKLIQTVLADYRDLFKPGSGGRETKCLRALLEVLDLFVEAGWPEARQLTHRLEEIYR